MVIHLAPPLNTIWFVANPSEVMLLIQPFWIASQVIDPDAWAMSLILVESEYMYMFSIPHWLMRPLQEYFWMLPPPYCASSELVSGTSMVTILFTVSIAVMTRCQFWSFEPAVHCEVPPSALGMRSIPMS